MRFLKMFLGIGVAIQMFLGCQLFESNKVTPQEIKSASTWSEKDQEPSFSDCDGFDQAIDKKNCFESMISNSIMDYISENPWESSQYIDEEIVLNLHIDKEGYFSLQDIERSKAIADAIPNMDESLEIAVSQIPQAQPAIKTNVGVFVATTLQLPIMISAQ
tara:strand:- start:1697 stop:2179 length:483 start_codon:yes stop_codon:yes gene_type:complete